MTSEAPQPIPAEASSEPAVGNLNVTNLATFAPSKLSLYTALVAVFASLLLISNICATKGVVFFPSLNLSLGPLQLDGLITDGAFWIFPLSYMIGDVISEVYGYRAMRRAVVMGFGVTVLAALAFWVAIQLPAAQWYEGQEALEAVAGSNVQILGASLAAFVVGELLNSLVLVRMKRRSGEPGLWRRLLGSSVVGQLVDTTIFCAIAASAIGVETFEGVLNYIVVGFVWKLLIEALMLPVTTQVIGAVKRAEPEYGRAV